MSTSHPCWLNDAEVKKPDELNYNDDDLKITCIPWQLNIYYMLILLLLERRLASSFNSFVFYS